MDLAKKNRDIFLAIAEQFTATGTEMVAIFGKGEDGIYSLVLGPNIGTKEFVDASKAIFENFNEALEKQAKYENDISKPSEN